MKSATKAPSKLFTVAPGVWGRKDVMVNYYMIQVHDSNNWVLIDTGLPLSAPHIRSMAADLFGTGSKPVAIILTHGHFDHVGAVKKLAKEWNVPVYAHYLETPYLTGLSNYPPPNSTVGGGIMASVAFLYPKSPIDISSHLRVLPPDGEVPFLTGWKYLHTPGHSPGHISLFRESDKTLIAGDAFVTTKQESLLAIMLQSKIMSGPPKYFTCDWDAAAESVATLTDLQPATAATGHGLPMRGAELQKELQKLNKNFTNKAVPRQGRYYPIPAIANANGVMYVPPKKPHKRSFAGVAFVAAAVVGFMLIKKFRQKEQVIAGK